MGRIARKYPSGRFILRTPTNIDEDKLYPVYLYYSYNRKQLRQSTSIMTTFKDWNQNANHGIGELRASYGSDYRRKNQQLQKLIKQIDGKIFDYVEQNGAINADVIKSFMLGDDKLLRADKGMTFSAYATSLLEKQYQHRKIRVSTYKNGISIINQFKKYMNDDKMCNKHELFVGDMTEDVVLDFLSWGIGRGLKIDTVVKYLENISKICKQASDDGFLSNATAQAIANIEVEDSLDEVANKDVKYLTREEISKIVHLEKSLLTKRQLEYIEMLLFSLYSCGIRISDLITLKWNDIDFENNFLHKKVMKTRRIIKIPLRDEALEILEKWKGLHEVFVFGLLPDDFNLKDEEKLRTRRNSITSNINKSLKRISKKAQLSKIITTHYMRHSFAVLAIEQGTSISEISELMGHKNSYITEEVYAKHLPSTLKNTVNEMKFNF